MTRRSPTPWSEPSSPFLTARAGLVRVPVVLAERRRMSAPKEL
jgi:hypothetical protein